MQTSDLSLLEARLVTALKHSCNANVGENSHFSALLRDFGLVPETYKKLAWIDFFEGYTPPNTGSDLKRFGAPVLAKAMLSLLRGSEQSPTRIVRDIKAAVLKARAERAEQRQTIQTNETPRLNLPPYQSLHERLDDALSLLEGAAASNNLLARHRSRLARFPYTANHDQITRYSASPTNPGLQGRDDAKANGNDSTRGWGMALRDGGAFGSQAAFDSMDDESSP